MDPQHNVANPTGQQPGDNTGGDQEAFALPIGNSTVQFATNGNEGNNVPAPPAPLTAINLAEHTETKKNYVQPPPTVDERLMQAKNFLSDEDLYLSSKYRKHYWEIDSLLRTLSDEKIPCNSTLFCQVRDMLRVINDRMGRIDKPIAELADPTRLVRYSKRLPTQDPAGMEFARHALRKEDHAPFTIDRKPDHARFVRAFRTNDKAGQRLREVERGAYFQTLKDPSLAGENLKDNTYEGRALKRGRKRAALQLALRAIGGNEEQNFAGDWIHRIVSLPQPPTVKAEEPRLCQGLPESERPAEPDRFAWTKTNIRFQQSQSQLVSWVNDERAQNRASSGEPDGELPTTPVVFYKPTQKPSIVAYRRDRRIARLAQLAFGSVVRFSYNRLSNGIEDPQAPSSPEAQVLIGALRQGTIEGDANNTRDVPTATQIDLLRQYIKAGGNMLQHGGDGDTTRSPLTDAELLRIEKCAVKSHSRPDKDTRDLLRRLRVELPDLISTAGTGNPEGSEQDRTRDREALRSFREDVAGKSPTQTAVNLSSAEGLANSLNMMRASVGTGETKSQVTDRILAENNEDVRDRRLEYRKVWSFSTTLPKISKLQNYFSMEKWPTKSHSPRIAQTATQTTTQTTTQTATGKRKAPTPLETAPATKRLREEHTPQATGGKRKATTDPETAPAPKRSTPAVHYRSLDRNDTRPSRHPGPAVTGFKVVKEDSHENNLRVGAGGLMPPEIKDFDVKKHRQTLENAPDPREKRLQGAARFPFGETSTTSLALNSQIRAELEGTQGGGTSDALVLQRPRDGNLATPERILPFPQNVGWTLPDPPPQLQIGELKQSAIFTTRALQGMGTGTNSTTSSPDLRPMNGTGSKSTRKSVVSTAQREVNRVG